MAHIFMHTFCQKSTDTSDMVKVKQSVVGPESSWRLTPPDFKTVGTLRWTRCQADAPAGFTPQEYLWYSFLLEVESEELPKRKIQMTPPGIEPVTFLFIAQCLGYICFEYIATKFQ